MNEITKRPASIVLKIAVIIGGLILANVVFSIMKLAHFLLPSFQTEDPPNLLLYAIGFIISLWALIVLCFWALPDDRLVPVTGVILFGIYILIRMCIIPDIPWFIFIITIAVDMAMIIYVFRKE